MIPNATPFIVPQVPQVPIVPQEQPIIPQAPMLPQVPQAPIIPQAIPPVIPIRQEPIKKQGEMNVNLMRSAQSTYLTPDTNPSNPQGQMSKDLRLKSGWGGGQ